ncbi:MAG: SusD/RagB family nutrient-binding outer membrane lipoprotein [Saprospiraceae bacterium]
MKNIIKLSFFTLLVFFMSACDNTELDGLLDNPNAVSADKAELDLVYNNVVLSFRNFAYNASSITLPLVRMNHMFGPRYNNYVGPGSGNGVWNGAYSELMPDLDLVIALAEGDALNTFSGSAKVMKAYILFTLVDLFGDVPFSEAFQGVANPSPAADDDEAVYTAALSILEDGISDLNAAKGTPSNDLYYSGSAAKWLKLANTMKLRYYVQTRLVNNNVSAVNALMDQVISSTADDFAFPYSSTRANPASRHPRYGAYETGGGDYMSNYYMWNFFGQKVNIDPRLRYYFYRQDCDETNEDLFTLDCVPLPYPLHFPPGLPWCTASLDFGDPGKMFSGYWGRDHGNEDGIPPDGLKRTTWGLYPAGGKFDADDCAGIGNGGKDGGLGAGIQPIMLASWVDFLKAEAVLTMGANGDAAALLESGVRKSIAKVMGFESVGPVAAAFKPTQADVDAYVNEVMSDFAAADQDGKLNIVISEFRLAAHGNGLEIYNAYRRTGKPSGMQPTRTQDPGAFPRTFFYPSNYVDRNAKATQRPDLETQVFWDTNPKGFIY